MLDLTYYGDDFTGSTDVMEALAGNGVPTVLFTRIPTADQLARFPDVRAIGLAGESRSRDPDWMDAHLPGAFEWLKGLGARHCHYKTCSTFDSAPRKGSIGRALEIGLEVFGQEVASLVVGAPQLRRYTMFGTLFASYQDQVYRIDRHPVMSRHPATPMAEADLRMHLAAQTSLPIGCVGPDATRKTTGLAALRANRQAGERVSIVDVYDAASQINAGALIEDALEETGPFIVGSSGVEYALLGHWSAKGMVQGAADIPPLVPETVIAVVSGSCSPTTERQIRAACSAGFAGIEVDFAALASGQGVDAALSLAFQNACAAIKEGRSPILYTALGQVSPDVSQDSADRVGLALGGLLRRLTDRFSLGRVGVAGGDTSSHALSALDIFALTLRYPLPDSPGSPICQAHRNSGQSFEIALKGGQVGGDDYFIRLRDGFPAG
ncbi:four-carbon acid sugar kinase family protein [Palleronia pelagia]|uniref:Uncharacterized conserved protein YgbK, DUF1537 family n=1 Tax=Palleronia pelagia TaxID=387096 RepID=A0A1H8DI72_9RHOB|nr:four-carbon acid sugar kinase family protein [Palleronia pelagia]SEN07021.1 Uncharacterized conserved protein YgbK, DUF1537 family [Palleronia pelagia]